MAKQVRFLRDYDVRVAPRVTRAFRRGTEDTLPDAQADAAIAAGAAELMADKTPSRRSKKDAG
jgi:predicted RNA-binding Zn ribbon-like protein